MVLAFFLCFLLDAGLIAPKPLTIKDKSRVTYEDFYVGGQVKHITSLLNLHKQRFKKSPKERWIFSLGDEKQQPIKNYLPYIQINVDSKNKRLIVDFFQLNQSKIKLEQIQKLVKKSKYIKSSNLLFDPIDSTTSVVFNFKEKTLVKVFRHNHLGPLAFELYPFSKN